MTDSANVRSRALHSTSRSQVQLGGNCPPRTLSWGTSQVYWSPPQCLCIHLPMYAQHLQWQVQSLSCVVYSTCGLLLGSQPVHLGRNSRAAGGAQMASPFLPSKSTIREACSTFACGAGTTVVCGSPTVKSTISKGKQTASHFLCMICIHKPRQPQGMTGGLAVHAQLQHSRQYVDSQVTRPRHPFTLHSKYAGQ